MRVPFSMVVEFAPHPEGGWIATASPRDPLKASSETVIHGTSVHPTLRGALARLLHMVAETVEAA
jgi:hypothetical protein